MEMLDLAARAMYKDGLDCSREELKALVVFVEKLIFKTFSKSEDYNYDYDCFTSKKYLERLVQ